jgi:DNA polymerase-1
MKRNNLILFQALNLPCLTKPGFEADDLIATYARIASEQGHRVTIISGDKDMLQLVNSNVRVYNPSTEQSIGTIHIMLVHINNVYLITMLR